MDDGSTYWAAMGAIAVAIIGLVGNKWAKTREERQRRSEITTAGEIESSRTREARRWALMEERVDDLESAIERLSSSNKRLQDDVDRVRAERDVALREAVDWEIAAKKASGSLARVTELEDRLQRERADHAAIVERLTSEIKRRGRR